MTTKFNQIVVWPATLVGADQAEDFNAFILEQLNTRAEFIGTFFTLPGAGGEGGRSDAVFRIHDDDVMKFAVPRLGFGMRWIEDVLDNEKRHISEGAQDATIYPPEFHALAKKAA